MRSYKTIIRNPLCIGAMIIRKYLKKHLSDSLYLRLLYFFEQGEILNLQRPKNFTEKIQWLKLYNRNPLFTKMVDKIEVKEIIKNIIGDKYIIPTIAVWDSFDDIDFDSMPNQFVLKSTNGSGGSVFICRCKSTFNRDKAKSIIEETSNNDVSITYREWPYHNIKPRILAEPLIVDKTTEDLIDYKFYCFGGNALYCQVIANRRKKETIDFYDREWIHQEFYGLNPSGNPSGIIMPKPEGYEEMLMIAEKISKGHIFLRVDLYNVNGKIYFGETTFYPASGFGVFTPKKWNRILGNLIELPLNSNQII